MKMMDDFNGRVIDLMMTADRQGNAELRDIAAKHLAESLIRTKKLPWWKRLFNKR